MIFAPETPAQSCARMRSGDASPGSNRPVKSRRRTSFRDRRGIARRTTVSCVLLSRWARGSSCRPKSFPYPLSCRLPNCERKRGRSLLEAWTTLPLQAMSLATRHPLRCPQTVLAWFPVQSGTPAGWACSGPLASPERTSGLLRCRAAPRLGSKPSRQIASARRGEVAWLRLRGD
jgi:hypothetical protein